MTQRPSSHATIEHVVFDDDPGVEVHPDAPAWVVDALTDLRDRYDPECPVPNCGAEIGWQRDDYGRETWSATVLLRIADGPIRAVCLDCGYPPALDITDNPEK